MQSEFKLSNSLVLSEEGLLKEERKDDKDGIFVSSLSEIEINEELGKGTSGTVSRVFHKPSGKYLALKVNKNFIFFLIKLPSFFSIHYNFFVRF